jgi:hypothetical protein
MKLLFVSLSIITSVCLVLFVWGCEKDPEGSSSPAKGETVTTSQLTEPAATMHPRLVGVAEQKVGPRIEFESILYNFGDVAPDSWNVCEFTFKNTGDEILRIGKIRTTCGCTVATLEKNVYEPGEQGVIKVKYHCGLKDGSRNKHIYVSSNDKEQPQVKLIIEANVVETGGT